MSPAADRTVKLLLALGIGIMAATLYLLIVR